MMNAHMTNPIMGPGAPKPPKWAEAITLADKFGWTIEYIEDELPFSWRVRINEFMNIQSQVEEQERKKKSK